MRTTVILRALSFCALLLGCSQDGSLPQELEDSRFPLPRKTAVEVVAQAETVASEMGIIVDNYAVAAVSFDYVKRRWHIVYEGKGRGIGDDFSVMIGDERPDEVELIPGL